MQLLHGSVMLFRNCAMPAPPMLNDCGATACIMLAWCKRKYVLPDEMQVAQRRAA